MKYRSVFDIIGPVMVGPSSSHTAGAARIGLMARYVFGRQPTKIEIIFLGSFAKTYKGHGTDIAVVGGVLGFNTFDKRMIDSLTMAKDLGVEVEIRLTDANPNHPNTVRIILTGEEESIMVEGISIGGGKIEITGLGDFSIRMTGETTALLIWHEDRFGVVASVSQLLARHQVNIGYMEMARMTKGAQALMVIETDQIVSEEICEEILSLDYIMNIKSIPTLP